MTVVTGLASTREHTVTDDDTAVALGSGSLRVLGTPRLLAWCEAATCAAVEPALEAGRTTVGTRVAVEHQRPSAVGTVVEVSASVVHVDGALLRFTVAVRQGGRLVGSGEITRVVVDTERFLARVPAP